MGRIAFTKAVLKFDNKVTQFAGLKPCETSCYKNVPAMHIYNSLDILFSKQEGYAQTLMAIAADQLGENTIRHGYVTIEVIITKKHGKLNRHTEVKIESN